MKKSGYKIGNTGNMMVKAPSNPGGNSKKPTVKTGTDLRTGK